VKDGLFVLYHGDGSWGKSKGQLRSKGTYKDGKKDGPWVAYYPDNAVYDRGTGTFKNGKRVSD